LPQKGRYFFDVLLQKSADFLEEGFHL